MIASRRHLKFLYRKLTTSSSSIQKKFITVHLFHLEKMKTLQVPERRYIGREKINNNIITVESQRDDI